MPINPEAVGNTSDSAEIKLLREQYAFAESATLDDTEMHALNAFFFWTAWSNPRLNLPKRTLTRSESTSGVTTTLAAIRRNTTRESNPKEPRKQ